MSAVSIYDEAIERLGGGNRIAAREELKRRAVALAQAVEERLVVEP